MLELEWPSPPAAAKRPISCCSLNKKKLRHQVNKIQKQKQSFTFLKKITAKELWGTIFAPPCTYALNMYSDEKVRWNWLQL